MSLFLGDTRIAGLATNTVMNAHNLFDIVEKDHELTTSEKEGFEKLGNYVYKEPFGDSRGYPDFINQAFAEYDSGIISRQFVSHNATKIGNIVDDGNGVLSRFWSTTDYATFPAVTPTSSFELVIKCYTPVLLANESILESNADKNGIILRCVNASTGQVNIWVGNGSWFISNVNTNCPISANTWTWFKIQSDGTTYTVSSSTDGVSYIQGYSVANTNFPDWNNSSSLQGLGGGSWENYPWQYGSIDLKACYLVIDSHLYWTGANFVNIRTNANGHKFFDIADKSSIDTIYATTKDAWFYGVDKTNNRVFLPRNAQRKLVKSVKNDALGNWCNLYSDGWCEQGGNIGTVDANWRTREINLLVPYKDVSYTVHINNSTTAQTYEPIIGANKTVNSFECFPYNAGGNANWSAMGYTDIVIPDYRYIVVGNSKASPSAISSLDITSSENDTIPLGYCIYQNSETQSNPAWLKSNGMWHTKIQYPTFYSYLMANIGHNNIVDSTTTIDDDTDKFIINQTTETFKLPIRTAERRLVYTYKNGSDWANWYSDGWCEQGGFYDCEGTAYNLKTINLLKPYKDTNYSLFIELYNEDYTSAAGEYYMCVHNKTTESFATYFDGNIQRKMWQASGYTAIPQLSDYNVSESLYVKVSNAVQNLQLLDVGTLMNYLKTFEVVDDLPENQLSNVFYFCKNFQD